jgi:hypothetical protein
VLCRVYQNDFGSVQGGDGNPSFTHDRNAVTLADVLVIHKDSSAGGNGIAVSSRRQVVFNVLSGLDCRAEYPRIGIDPQGILVLRKSAREGHEASGVLRVGKGFGCPVRIESAPTRQ